MLVESVSKSAWNHCPSVRGMGVQVRVESPNSILESTLMARTTAPLTDTACRTAKPREREYKLFDGDGLYLLVQPNGRKGWRLRYVKPDGREGLTSLGSYPVVGLADARRKRFELKQQLANGIDPIQTASQGTSRGQRPYL